MSKPSLIVGRITTLKGGDQAIEPIGRVDPHKAVALEHQRKVAALIAAAYLYRDEPSARTLRYLKQAALAL